MEASFKIDMYELLIVCTPIMVIIALVFRRAIRIRLGNLFAVETDGFNRDRQEENLDPVKMCVVVKDLPRITVIASEESQMDQEQEELPLRITTTRHPGHQNLLRPAMSEFDRVPSGPELEQAALEISVGRSGRESSGP